MLKIKRKNRSGRLLHSLLPVLVWVVAVGCIGVLFQRRVQRFEVLGIAQGQVRQIAATSTGRLTSVPVELFQHVRQGDVVAIINTVLDNEQLEAELAIASAKIGYLAAQLVSTKEAMLVEAAERGSDLLSTDRRYAVDVENVRLRILELQTQIETDRITLKDLATEVQIEQSLLDDKISSNGYNLHKAQVSYDASAMTIEGNEQLLLQANADLDQALARRGEFAMHQIANPSVDGALKVVRKAIAVQEKVVDALMARRKPVVLRSPIDGVVSQILRRPVRRTGEGVVRQMLRRSGEVVTPEEPILTISATKPSQIIAYASEEQLESVRVGMTVQIVKRNDPLQIADSQVTYLGPIMEVMPQRLWQVDNIPEWGQPMLIKVPAGLKLIPGEMVGIKGL